MAKVKITGTFKMTENIGVDMEVYRPNPEGYSFRNYYSKKFTKTFDDLIAGKLYFVDLAGHAVDGTFEISITGDVENDIQATYRDFFVKGLKFKTK